MAREERIKTKLGKRLRAIRSEFGDPDREVFCLRLGISKGSLGNYERGDRVPDSSVLLAYRKEFGVDVNWIVTGEGGMFHHPVEALSTPGPLISSVFKAVKTMVRRVNEDAGIKLPIDAFDEEAIRWYNELVSMARGNLDEGKLQSMLPALEYELKQAVRTAAAEPGTGKRLA